MNTFDWNRFKNEKIAVNCKTKEEAEAFLKKAKEHGIKWMGNGNDDFVYFGTLWDIYEDLTCYHYSVSFEPNLISPGIMYCDKPYAIEQGFTVIDWKEIEQVKYNIIDCTEYAKLLPNLSTGMIVTLANDEEYLFFDKNDVIAHPMLVREDSMILLRDYDDSLKHKSNSCYDIIKIEQPTNPLSLLDFDIDRFDRKVLWVSDLERAEIDEPEDDMEIAF